MLRDSMVLCAKNASVTTTISSYVLCNYLMVYLDYIEIHCVED